MGERSRLARGHAGLGDGVVGISSGELSVGYAEHFVVRGEAGHAGPGCLDDSREVGAERQRQRLWPGQSRHGP